MMQAPAFPPNLGVDLPAEDPLTSSGATLKKSSTLWITRNVKMPCHTTLALYLLSGHSMLSNFLLSPCLTTGEDGLQLYDCTTLCGNIIITFHCRPSRLHMIPSPLPAPSLPSSSPPGTAWFKNAQEAVVVFFSGKYFRHI